MSALSTRPRPRVGHIQFLNCLPLYHGLVHDGSVLDMDFRKGTPTELNRLLLADELDITPISSIEYLRHPNELVLLPNLTVSSNGPVKSIALVSRVDAKELQGRPVALANTSATSQVLVRIILAERFGVTGRFFECPPDLSRMLDEADAALLIGDPALRVLWQLPPGLRCYDLGAEWQALTGRAMVYAVWAVRRDYALRASELVQGVLDAFLRSLRFSQKHVEEIAQAAARWEPFPAEVLADYFRTLQFEFGPSYQEGLRTFADRASRIGALERVPELEFALPS